MLAPFSKRFFKEDNPVCVISLDDEMFTQIADTYLKPGETNETGKQDLTLNWAESLSQLPVVQEISKVIVGNSSALKITRAMIYTLAQKSKVVLILGESGTGKELIAEQLVRHSVTNKKPFIVVNCGAIPETMLEEELFGHVTGAFTDAKKDRAGLFEAADGGTIFLDEIGDLPLVSQAKLLRVLDKKETRRLGSNDNKTLDVRVIAATNRDLHKMMEEKTFRQDLYYRLEKFVIRTKPLSDFPDDIPVIASHIWTNVLKNTPPLNNEFLKLLTTMKWPGNVRDLKNALDRIGDFFPGVPLSEEHIRIIQQLMEEERSDAPWIHPVSYKKLFDEESMKRIILSHRIIRGIKIRVRPLLNVEYQSKAGPSEMKKIQQSLTQELKKLDELLIEPVFFKSLQLYDHIRCFRFNLEKICLNWPGSRSGFKEMWNADVQMLYKKIIEEIFVIVWQTPQEKS
jgi:transcriptional regulator with GAF, ATPase, and Fis domain